MNMKRKTDKETKTFYRSDRLVRNGAHWFFETREGTVEGPFDSQSSALAGLSNYIQVMTSGMLPEDDAGLSLEPIEPIESAD